MTDPTEPGKKMEEPAEERDKPREPGKAPRPDHWRTSSYVFGAVIVLIVVSKILEFFDIL